MSALTDPAQALIDLHCRALKLPGLRTGYAAIARDATSQGQSYVAFLAACLAQEVTARRQQRLAARLSAARFPAPKTLDSFDFRATPQLPKSEVLALAAGTFIGTHENVICLGQPGTGKTHSAHYPD